MRTHVRHKNLETVSFAVLYLPTSTTPSLNPLPRHKHNPTQSPNYDVSVAQDIIRSLTWKTDLQKLLSDKAVLSVMIYVQRCHRNLTLMNMKVLNFREKWAKFQTKAQKNSKLNVNQENNHDPYGRAGDLYRIREIPRYSERAGRGLVQNLNSDMKA